MLDAPYLKQVGNVNYIECSLCLYTNPKVFKEAVGNFDCNTKYWGLFL